VFVGRGRINSDKLQIRKIIIGKRVIFRLLTELLLLKGSWDVGMTLENVTSKSFSLVWKLFFLFKTQ